jgi:hypothetical protein
MAIRKTGARRISVDGVIYLWRVRHKPTYDQECFRGRLTVAIQRAEGAGQVLLVRGDSRPDNIYGDPTTIVTPRTVADAIRLGLASGWHPNSPGSPVEIVLTDTNLGERNEP